MKDNIPVLLLKKLSLLPLQEVRLELNNELSKKIIDLSMSSYNKKILVILPLNALEESPSVKDLPEVGILALVKSKIELPNGNFRVVIKGLNRVKTLGYFNAPNDKSILISSVKRLYIDKGETTKESALKRKLIELIKKYIKLNPESSNSISSKIGDKVSLDILTDEIVNFINLNHTKKTEYMNEISEEERARKLIEDLSIELEIIRLNNKLEQDIRLDFEKEQREYLLKAKINKLNEELGVTSSKEKEVLEYKDRIESLDLPNDVKIKLSNELKKYDYTPESSPDNAVIRNYIDTLITLPFNKQSKEETNNKKIIDVLNENHYGVLDIKERISEYAALKKINSELKSPVICLVGPPGVGKTTLAISISEALKREFFKISVGGLNDSAELIGHRRTYLGASPGKIISGIKKCGVNNPVILIDEIDKMVKDYKGDPASVLLDVLDSNQNKTFIDNYIEEPFDLSSCLFILTANDEALISPPLKDRLEIMYIESYSIYDKKDIAINYLIPKIFLKYNYKKLKIAEELIIYIIKNYTAESGVRSLERILDKLIRNIIINKKTLKDINLKYVEEILGDKIHIDEIKDKLIGTANVLGVTPVGGKIVNIEAALIPNNENLEISGDVGDITKDNINVVISYLKKNKLLNLKNENIHINFSQDFPLNGSSGSLGVVAAILSLINNKAVDNKIAFTGKLDLSGNVLRVNSIKEKIIVAHNNNIKTIYLPKDNELDVKSVPDFILNELKLIFVNNVEDVSKSIFKKSSKKT